MGDRLHWGLVKVGEEVGELKQVVMTGLEIELAAIYFQGLGGLGKDYGISGC